MLVQLPKSPTSVALSSEAVLAGAAVADAAIAVETEGK